MQFLAASFFILKLDTKIKKVEDGEIVSILGPSATWSNPTLL